MACTIGLPVWAQEGSFSLDISSDSVLIGNYFQIRFTVENFQGKFEPPDFNDFTVVGGPNRSSSFSMINGETKQTISYTYYLKPLEIGRYTIPPAYIVQGEKTLETPPVDIIVVPNPDGLIKPPSLPEFREEYDFPGLDDFFRRPKSDETPKPTKKKLKVRKV